MTSFSFAQEKKDEKAIKKANNYVYEGNSLSAKKDGFVSAEMAYRKAISNQPTTVAGIYNLGNSYFKSKNYEEALYRHEQAAKMSTSKAEKHKAFHNIGNILMENKKCKEAVEAYKNALRNDPTDEETRYNLGLAKICADQQKDEDKEDKNKDENKKDEKKENKDNKDENKKEGDDKKDDKGKPKDEKSDKGKDGEDKKEPQQPKPQPGKLSPQQIKNLLEAMNNQEQKVQEKVNADKQKGVKVKTDKDW